MPKPDELNEQSTREDEVYWGKWERSNRLSLMIMKRGIPEAFRGAVTNVLKTGLDRPVGLVQPSADHHSGLIWSFRPD